MKNDDVELIKRILDGEEIAFTELVEKYHKPVHALAWRKISDYHIAEEITQDTFLKVYQKLHTLKDLSHFSGWLYVITTNLCATWIRKNQKYTERLKKTEITITQSDTYSQHIRDDRANSVTQTQREIVKKLLAKLKESERTVMTLHYLGEMKIEDISRFLGVSVSTIKTRLMRARQRLRQEETMIRDALEHFKISPNLTDNIMQEISQTRQIAPTTGKPFIPWIVGVTAVTIVLLMLGFSNQFLSRFQKPYSLEAQSEMTVELVEAPIVQEIDAEPNVRRQFGNTNALGESDNNGQKPDDGLLAAAEPEGETVSVPKQQWIQSEAIKGSRATSLHATPEGDLYVYDFGFHNNIYKLPSNGTMWQSISEKLRLDTVWSISPAITKWNDTLYFMPTNKLFASKDEGKTWDLLHSWEGERGAIEFVQMEQAFYVAFENGIFKSEDAGKSWNAIHDEKIEYIESLFKIQDTLIVRTYNKLYRLEDDKWQLLEFPVPVRMILSVAVSEDKLYVAVFFNWEEANVDRKKMDQGQVRGWWIYRSTDLGNSWKDITPTNAWNIKGWPPAPKMIATGETLLVMERGMVRSTDGGDTWMPSQPPDTSPFMRDDNNAVALNENTFYVGSDDGLYRSTDGGSSWEIVKVPLDKTRRIFFNLITSEGNKKGQNKQNTLYGIVEVWKITKTTNNGKTWKDVKVDLPMTKQLTEAIPHFIQIVPSGNTVYAKGGSTGGGKMRHYKVSKDGYTLVPIQDMPAFNSIELRIHLHQAQDLSIQALQDSFSGATQFFKQMLQLPFQQRSKLEELGLLGPFAVSGDTFYSEYNFKLFRWEPGNTKWYDTGQEETTELSLDIFKPHFIIPKLAVLGNTVYYGKRDGSLVVSFDRGDNWIDLTPGLPFKVKTFKGIVFAGTTVYVATNAGIITSDDGKAWKVVTDSDGANVIMEHLAVDGTTLYGITKKTAVYRLESDSDTWKLLVSKIPAILNFEGGDIVTSLAAADSTLYIGSERSGMLHFTIEE